MAGVLGMGGDGPGAGNGDDDDADDGLFGDGGEGGEGEVGGVATALGNGAGTVEAASAGPDGPRTVADELRSVRQLQPSDSSQEDTLLRAVRRARDAIEAMASSVEDEERRRAEGVTLWR